MWSSDGSDDESIIIPNPEDSYQYAETVGPSEEEDNANNCEMPKFRNDRVFGWELLITRAYASLKKQQVLHVPNKCFRRVLKGRDSIAIKTQHNGDSIRCTMITYERKEGKQEMYLSKGWFEFVSVNNLKRGDKLRFQLSNPPDVMFVEIIRRKRSRRNISK
ncbi:hypothetical protein P8452_41882 [Trifolium repens]|nr:hypothetical protein P8452_41882 [Trifolium repens]